MNVAYHSSNEFSPILGVSITSLFENNKDFEEINVFIIEKAINKINKEKLLKLAQSYGRNIYFIDMPEINETEKLNLVKVSSKWGFDGYIRIFLDIILIIKILFTGLVSVTIIAFALVIALVVIISKQ